MIIGSHVSFTKDKQLLGSLEEALSYNATTFMFYTGAPQNTMRYEINSDLTEKAVKLMEEKGIDINKVIVHAPYIVNLANKDPEKHKFAINFIKQEISRCDMLGIKNLVLHPGSRLDLSIKEGLDNIVDGLNKILEDGNARILIETMAGKGTELGVDLEQIKYIIDNVCNKNRIGVCLDTCHLNDSGVDISKFDEYLESFDKLIGINYIYCVHVNDSKNPIGSHKDRHDNIGYGTIGFDNLINVIYNEKLKDVPKILETPYINERAPYKEEIENILNKKMVNKLKDE